jgi:UDP-N-acetylmuramoyl-tripeptide--D-alanyl-D-alanine ligase
VIWLRLAVATPLAALNGVRWLRVAQREHYAPGRVTRFALRWRLVGWGLALRGTRPGPLRWTARTRRLAAVAGVLGLVLIMLSWPTAVVAVVLAPVLIDIALFLTRFLEDRLSQKWVTRAQRKLASVRPAVVAITGSYGKTSTKGYVAHLLAPVRSVVASPGSFNNRLGLARAVNENLAPGTEVFVAEMGTYGPGEIAALCEWLTPSVAGITAIGPVHLERFGSEDRIVAAKSEIFQRADVAVLNADDPRLAALAPTLPGRVVEARAADPLVDLAPPSAPPTNVAVAIAIARELGATDDVLRDRLPSLPSPAHRLVPTASDKGFAILDDTFNANPAGARRALDVLARHDAAGRRVVVTPGMYELGPTQAAENRAFAEAAAAVATDLVLVGRTNRRALVAGAGRHGSVHTVANRDDAVAWVVANLGPGDVVLYENDQPDYFP